MICSHLARRLRWTFARTGVEAGDTPDGRLGAAVTEAIDRKVQAAGAALRREILDSMYGIPPSIPCMVSHPAAGCPHLGCAVRGAPVLMEGVDCRRGSNRAVFV